MNALKSSFDLIDHLVALNKAITTRIDYLEIRLSEIERKEAAKILTGEMK